MGIVPVEQAATLALKKIIPYSKMLVLLPPPFSRHLAAIKLRTARLSSSDCSEVLRFRYYRTSFRIAMPGTETQVRKKEKAGRYRETFS
jgi:hypothetical protein